MPVDRVLAQYQPLGDIGIAQSLRDELQYVELAWCQHRPGLALAGRGGADPGWSARLHGAADQALADLGHALQPLEARLADLDRQRLRAAMGAQAFEAEYTAGRTLDLAQVLAELGPKDAAAGQARVTVSGEAVTALTPRELDVLKLVAQGLSNPDIARRLFLSEHTVHRHLANILRKLDLSSRRGRGLGYARGPHLTPAACGARGAPLTPASGAHAPPVLVRTWPNRATRATR